MSIWLTSLDAEASAEIYEAEHHIHNRERWLGAAGSPSGETHVADRVGTTVTAFQADGGDNTWGDWLQVLGSDDTPIGTGMAYYDLHRAVVVDTERTGIHLVQIAFGDSGAAGLAADDYTEFVFVPGTPQNVPSPVAIIDDRKAAGTKAWLRVWAVGQNTGTVDVFIGLHEYAR